MMLRQYGDRLADGAVVVMTVSYLSPFWNDTPEQFQAKQERYYRVLDPWNIVGVDLAHWVLQRFSPLVVPPYSEAYNQCFSEEFFSVFGERMETLSETYGVPLLDYSHDARFTGRIDLFADLDHLNFTGAEAFDAVVWEDLADLGLM